MAGPQSLARGWSAVLFIGTLGAALFLGLVLVLDALFPPPLARLTESSVAVLDRGGTPLRLFATTGGIWRLPTVPDQVSQIYLDLLLAAEDKRFYHHFGVDPLAVVRAVAGNLTAGRVVSGASTLTMQVARMLAPRPRTLKAKLIEAVRALQLEARYDKTTLLGFYLTLAPFGGTLEGLRSATLTFYGKPPRELTVAEAALLVALPRAPSRLRPDRWAEQARRARTEVLRKAVAAGVITAKAAIEAEDEPMPALRQAPPFSAPHLAERLRAAYPGQAVIRTTLDGRLQREVEALAVRETRSLHPRAGLAVVVVDNASRGVLVALGAPAYFDEARNGPIDMTQAQRSPGSALKPFLYGLGFDDRVIHPETLVSDVSTRFGGYAPANFDRGFHGELTVREALQQSLNVPAVMVLDRVGPARFAQALRRAGARLLFPRADPNPGLPLALGGVGITLWDMTTLYTGLARNGQVAPLVVTTEPAPTPAPTPAESVTLMSPDAARQVVAILRGTPPPPGLMQDGGARRGPRIAMKTGTSYGFRDAWAFGITTRHTVGVWVGRPDGTPSPDRYGRNTAAPLLYKVFDLLPEQREELPDQGESAATPITEPPPALLRRLEPGNPDRRVIAMPDAEKLRLIFPTPGIVVDWVGLDGEPAPLMMIAAGGRRPLTWLIDGRPLASPPTRREVLWQPPGPGFSTVTVLDADGRAASAEIQVK
ncbi:penicillin-binding protein 1C [uncultured Gammaproteobacteria bacterium]